MQIDRFTLKTTQPSYSTARYNTFSQLSAHVVDFVIYCVFIERLSRMSLGKALFSSFGKTLFSSFGKALFSTANTPRIGSLRETKAEAARCLQCAPCSKAC